MRFSDLKLSNVFALGAVLVSGFMLFNVSQQVQESERQLKRVEREIDREKEMIRVLNAEWAYLNRPDRLEHLAQQYLGMEIMDSEAVLLTSASLPEKRLYMPPPARPSFSNGVVSVAYKAEKVKQVEQKQARDLQVAREITQDFRSILTALERSGVAE